MLLYGADEEVGEWASVQLFDKKGMFERYKAIGVVLDNKLICGVVYNNFCLKTDGSPLTIEMSIASIDKRWATRQNLRKFFAYPFIQLGLERVQTACFAENEGVIMFNKRLGFKEEGRHRKAWPDGGDSVSFGMLKDECKWL